MKLIELYPLTEASDKKKKNKKDKSADKYLHYVAGNMIFKDTCSGKLSGDTK